MKNLKLWAYSALILSVWNVTSTYAREEVSQLNAEVLTQARALLQDVHLLRNDLNKSKRARENREFESIARENMLICYDRDNQQDMKALQRTTPFSWSTFFSSAKEFVLACGVFGFTCYLAALIQKGPRLSC